MPDKYWFICDQEECDSAVEFHARDGFGFPNGIVSMTCPCGRKMQHISTQTTERSTTVETTTPETQATPSLADEITSKIATLEAQIETLRKTLGNQRVAVSSFYEAINEHIESNELNEDSTITLADLSEFVESAFGNPLSFPKEYEAFIEFTVKARVVFNATDDDSAREFAENIELSVSDDDISYDGDAEVNEVYVDDTSIKSVEATN